MAKHLDLSAIPPSLSTTIDPDFGIVQDLSDSGVLHRRGLFGSTYYLVTLSWDLLTVSQRQTLEWFFSQEAKLEPITFTLDGHDYTGELISGPTRRYITGTLYGLTVTVRGTRASASFIQTPTNVSPADGADVATNEPTLTGSAFAVTGSDTHVASRFQIYSVQSGDLLHSAEIAPATLEYTVPAGVLSGPGLSYEWTVEYKGDLLGWSDPSARTTFTPQTVFVDSGALAGNTTLTRSTTANYWGI